MGLGSILEFRDDFATYVDELRRRLDVQAGRSRFGLIALDCWQRRAGAVWSRWRR